MPPRKINNGTQICHNWVLLIYNIQHSITVIRFHNYVITILFPFFHVFTGNICTLTNHKLNKKEWKNAGKSFYFIEKYAGAKNRQICKKWVLVINLLVCMTSLQMNTAVVGTHLGPSLLIFWYMPIPYMPYLYLWLYRLWIQFCLNYIRIIVS